MNTDQYNKGTTLIETLTAMAIMGVLVVVVASLIHSILIGQKRDRVMVEVEYQAASLMYDITQNLRNATGISVPAVGASGSTLNIAITSIPSQNPTRYTYTTPSIFISRAGASATKISSDTVNVTNLTFQNITQTVGEAAVRVSLTVASKNPTGESELAYSTTLTTTVTIR